MLIVAHFDFESFIRVLVVHIVHLWPLKDLILSTCQMYPVKSINLTIRNQFQLTHSLDQLPLNQLDRQWLFLKDLSLLSFFELSSEWQSSLQ